MDMAENEKLTPPRIENIPYILKTLPQWVNWTYEERAGKLTKPPINPKYPNQNADSTKPETWGTFKEAHDVYRECENERIAGVGIVLNRNGIVAVDLDRCLDNGTISPRAKEIIEKLNSYTETTPSKKGLRIFIKGELPFDGKKKKENGLEIEVYQASRYVTVTGHHVVGFPLSIEDRQTEIESVCKEIWGKNLIETKTKKIEFDTSPELWQKAQREIARHPRIMQHWLAPKPDDRSGHDWRLACLCLEEGITDPGTLYQIILNNPHGKARSYPNTDKYIRDIISRAVNQSGITRSDSTEFPFSIVSGIAGDFADLYSQYIEAPKEFLFTGFLCSLGSILAGKVSVKSELRFDTNLYIVFLGDSAKERKSSSIEASIGFFHEFFPNVLSTSWGVGSAEGLQTRLKNTEQGRLLLAIDEMDGFVNKCKIQGSILLQAANILFEKTHYENTTKDSKVVIDNAHLSIIGATTKAIYDRLWDERFIRIGFINRIFLVPGISEPKFPVPQKIPIEEKKSLAKRTAKILSDVGERLSLEISREAEKEFNEWYFSIRREDTEHAKRLDTYALRFMPLLALNDGKKEIDLETTQKAITLMNWQKNIRETFDPIDSTNEVARTEEKIRRLLKVGDQSTRELKRNLHIERIGVWFFNKAIGNLSEGFDKEIRYNHETKKWTLI